MQNLRPYSSALLLSLALFGCESAGGTDDSIQNNIVAAGYGG